MEKRGQPSGSIQPAAWLSDAMTCSEPQRKVQVQPLRRFTDVLNLFCKCCLEFLETLAKTPSLRKGEFRCQHGLLEGEPRLLPRRR